MGIRPVKIAAVYPVLGSVMAVALGLFVTNMVLNVRVGAALGK